VRLGIVSGRLRQGKTYLLDAAANTFDGFFLTAADSTETDSLASFGRVLASYSGGGRYAFADWDGTGAALERMFGVVAKVSGAARSRSTWLSSRPTSRDARVGCYLSVKPSGTRS
jgi:hypothetical protein